MKYVLLLAFLLLCSIGEAEERMLGGPSLYEKTRGDDFGKNAGVLARAMSVAKGDYRSQPITLLQRSDVIDELKLTDVQQARVDELVQQNELDPIFRKLGVTDAEVLGEMSPYAIHKLKRKAVAIVIDRRSVMNVELMKLLDARQLARLRQIYLQELALTSRQSIKGPLDLGVSITHDEANRILVSLREKQAELNERMRSLKLQMLQEASGQALGDERTNALIGKLFVPNQSLPSIPIDAN